MKARFLTRCFGLAFLIFLFLLLFATQMQTEERVQANVPSSWAKAKKAFNRLVCEPSSLTAREFYVSISDGKGINSDKTEILDHIFGQNIDMWSIGRYPIIAIEMLNGNIYAARSAIRLLGFIDNGWQKPRGLTFLVAMRVGASLGELIRANPGLFLRACYEEREDPYLKEKGFPVNFIPFILHMKKTMVSYEMEMRREAVRSVEDPELRLVRNECLETIDKGTGLFERHVSDSPGFEEHEERRLEDPGETVKNVFLEMKNRPSPENMKKVLALFDVRREDFHDVISAIFPDWGWPPRPQTEADPLVIILHEARCGNEYAIDVLFSALLYASRYDDLSAQMIYNLISNLILMKPAVFIEKLAKYRYLEAERPDTVPENTGPVFLDLICSDISVYDYPCALNLNEVILRRRVDALAALDIPEHKELIDRCIRLIEKNLK